MKLLRARPTITAASAVLAVLALATTACNRESDASTSAEGGGKAAIGIDLPRSDTDFWNSYAEYLKKDIETEGANALPISNSQNDVTKLVSNVQVFENTGAKAIVMAPQDTGAIASTLDNLASKKIPVISVDTRPDKGDVYMVVRADNRAYGTKACEYLGKQLGGKGKVAEFQ